MTRETSLRQRLSDGQPDMVVDLYLYPTTDGGKTKPVGIGWGCPCSNDQSLTEGWDGYPLLDSEMMPGERRRVGLVFLSGSAAVEALEGNDRFYLWEGRFIGEAAPVRFGGMTVNERLWAANLIGAFDAAAKARDRTSMVDILSRVAVSDPEASVDTILANPSRYGF